MPHHAFSSFSVTGGNTHSSEGLTLRMPEDVTFPLVIESGAAITVWPDGSMEFVGENLKFRVIYDGSTGFQLYTTTVEEVNPAISLLS